LRQENAGMYDDSVIPDFGRLGSESGRGHPPCQFDSAGLNSKALARITACSVLARKRAITNLQARLEVQAPICS